MRGKEREKEKIKGWEEGRKVKKEAKKVMIKRHRVI